MFLLAEAGTERYVPWAKRAAARLDAKRQEMGLFALVKTYFPEASVQVWIKATEAGRSIRITGHPATGWQFHYDSATHQDRWYYVDGRALKYYNEWTTTASGGSGGTGSPRALAALALGGKSFAHQADALDGSMYLARRGRAAQLVSDAEAFPSQLGIRDTRPISQLDGQTDFLMPAYYGAPGMQFSEDGEVFATTSRLAASKGLPRVFALSPAQLAEEASVPEAEWGSTQFDEVLSGMPQFVTDFYAGVGTSIDANQNSGSLALYALSAGSVGGLPLRLELRALFDRFSDAPVVEAFMPYAASVALNTGLATYEAVLAARYVVARYDRASNAWVVARQRDFPDLALYRVTGSSTTARPGILSAPLDYFDLNNPPHWAGADRGADGPHQWTLVPNATVTPSGDHYDYAYSTDRPVLYRDGAVVSTALPKFMNDGGGHTRRPSLLGANATSALVTYTGTGGGSLGDDAYLGTSWCGTWGATQITSSTNARDLHLAPAADELWYGRTGALPARYFRGGSLVRNFGSRPAADAASYALYGAPSPEGFYFPEPVGWSYDHPRQMRALLYRKITLTPGSGSGDTKLVYAGTVDVPGFGTIVVPVTSGPVTDGLSADGALYWSVSAGAFVSFTPADFDATFSTSGSTFHPNLASSYLISTGSTPDSYAWDAPATGLVEYVPDDDRFRVVRLLSEAATPYPARDGADATPATISLSEATLVQREFVPHP